MKRKKPAPVPATSWKATSLVLGALFLASLAAYSNSFHGGFIYDDLIAVLMNPSIHDLGDFLQVLNPPSELTVGGRPFLNFTFALNYAISGQETWSYHALNYLVHLLTGFTLFAVMRRTLLSAPLRDRFGRDALPLAAAVALLWMLHPLQTESVTYISQRSESIMALFYLFTLYAFLRHLEGGNLRELWAGLAVASCALGMATKEVMVTAPVIALLYDRTFVAGTFRETFRQRWWFYLCLAATWLVFAYSLLDVSHRDVGTGRGISMWEYALTECGAIVHYLCLAIWPHPLIFDYGTAIIVRNPLEVLPQIIVLSILAAFTIYFLAKRPVWGFVGAWFFIILAPASSIIPITLSPVSEHRMYLPLVSLVALLVLVLYAEFGRKSWWGLGLLAILWGGMTWHRNKDYDSMATIWGATLAFRPENERAQNNYGAFLNDGGRPDLALPHLQEAVRLKPDYFDAHNNYGQALAMLHHPQEAYEQFITAIQLKPRSPEAHINLGNLLVQSGHAKEAVEQYQAALDISPNSVSALNGMGAALDRTGRPVDSLSYFQQALQIDPNSAEARNNYGLALADLHRPDEAIEQFQAAVRLRPGLAPNHANLAGSLFALQRFAEALTEYQEAARLDPNSASAVNGIGASLELLGHRDEAIEQYRKAAGMDPTYSLPRENLRRMKAPAP